MNRASTSSGPSLLDKSKATPGSVDMSIFEKKGGGQGKSGGSGPVGQGTTSSDYLQKTREDNPEPNADNKTDSVTLGNCRITTTPDKLAAEQPFEMAVDVKGPETATTGTVTFNLFCTVPKAGGAPEAKDMASPSQATVKDGKAMVSGTLAAPDPAPDPGTKVQYHVVAQHPKAPEKAESPKVEVESGKIPVPLAVWSLGSVHFGFDSSFILPSSADEIAGLKQLLAANPGAVASIFGHADPVGKDDYNKTLSGRRAHSLYCLLTKNVDGWIDLSKGVDGDRWDLKTVQSILTRLKDTTGATYYGAGVDGVDGSRTKAAVKSFQKDNKLYVDGVAGPKTKAKLYAAYMGDLVPSALAAADFIGDPADKKHQWACNGCGEFNPVLVFSKSDDSTFKAATDKKPRNEKNAPNRRATVLLFPASTKGPGNVTFPCPPWSDGVAKCKAQLFDDADKRRNPSDAERTWSKDKDTYACKFYAKIGKDDMGGGAGPVLPGTAEISNVKIDKTEAWVGDEVKITADSTLADGTDVSIAIRSGDKELSKIAAKVSGGKIDKIWSVCECGIEDLAGGVFPAQVDVSIEIDWNDLRVVCTDNLKVKPILEAPSQTFTNEYTWSGYSVHSEFDNKIEGHVSKVSVKKKILKARGGYWVDMRTAPGFPAGHFNGDPTGFGDGLRWGRQTGTTMAPDEYWDGTSWNPIPSTTPELPSSAIGFIQTTPGATEWVRPDNTSFAWPERLPDYDFDDTEYVDIRASWIVHTNSRWTGKFKLRTKGCCDQHPTGNGGHPVEMNFEMERIEAHEAHSIPVCPGALRANAGCFFYGDTREGTIPHEIGHLVGLPDEYEEGAIDTSQPDGDGLVAGLDPTAIMGDNMDIVKKRHYVNFAMMAEMLAKSKTTLETEYAAV